VSRESTVLAAEMDGLEDALTQVLSEELAGIANVQSDLALSVRDVVLEEEALRLTVRAVGSLALDGFTLQQ